MIGMRAIDTVKEFLDIFDYFYLTRIIGSHFYYNIDCTLINMMLDIIG